MKVYTVTLQFRVEAQDQQDALKKAQWVRHKATSVEGFRENLPTKVHYDPRSQLRNIGGDDYDVPVV